MNSSGIAFLVVALSLLIQGMSCTPAASPDNLDDLGTIRITIKDQTFELWVADDAAEQSKGLMSVPAERMAPLSDGTERGMIFVFDHERYLSFWMKDTIIPLDIAYIASEGTVVKTYTMVPLDTRPGQYPSGEPARFAIEVNAGVWDRIGLESGDRIDIPPSLLNR